MLQEGQQLGEFEILAKLGQGGMGAVYKARQTVLRRLVAIKTLQSSLSSDAEFVTRFHNEAVAAAGLNHPNLVQVYAAGQSDGIHWFAMEFVDGESVQARLKRLGKLEAAEALAIGMHVQTALEHGWRKAQLIHRDIKPDNIFLSNDGEVKLGDLGLAKSSDQQQGLTMTGASMGTPLYISPEQAEGKRDIDFRTDIYSLGATLFHLLSGSPVYSANSAVSVMIKHIGGEIPDVCSLNPDLPPAVGAVVTKMLQKAPADRHASYAELSADLQRAYASLSEAPQMTEPLHAAGTSFQKKASRSFTPRIALAFGLPLLALALAAMGWIVWTPDKGAPSSKTPNAGASSNSPGQWRVLFDGKTFSGWRGVLTPDPVQWRILNGEITGEGHNWLMFDEPFEDFELELEWKVSDEKKSNGGIFFRTLLNEGKTPIAFLEMQLCGREFNEDAGWKSGSCWGLLHATRDASFPAGIWNTARLEQKGNHCKHWVNGVPVCDYEIGSPEWKQLPESGGLKSVKFSKSRTESVSSGLIGLQSVYGCSYRNIRIKPLPSSSFAKLVDKAALAELVRRLEKKLLPVPLTSVHMSCTEFTVAEWKLYAKASGSDAWMPHEAINPLHEYPESDEHPVAERTWHQAKACCDWLSFQTGKTWRLPKNSEWEAAAGKSKYPWGDSFPPKPDEGNYAVLESGQADGRKIGVDGIKGTAPVASFKPNSLGFYDLGGNVQEWMLDGMEKDARVLRGCDWWKGEEQLLLSSHRYFHASEVKKSGVGFRIVCER